MGVKLIFCLNHICILCKTLEVIIKDYIQYIYFWLYLTYIKLMNITNESNRTLIIYRL